MCGVAAVVAVGLTGCARTGDLGASAPVSHARASQHDPSRTVRQLEQQGLKVHERARSSDGNCAANSYDDVRSWLGTHSCSALFRELLEVTDARGGAAMIAVAWVDMPTNAAAADLEDLIDRNGTGNLTELTRAVRFTGKNYASTRDGFTTLNAQAEPVGPTAPTIAPDTLAQIAVS